MPFVGLTVSQASPPAVVDLTALKVMFPPVPLTVRVWAAGAPPLVFWVNVREFDDTLSVAVGDTITTDVSVKDVYERGGMGFYVFETVSTNQDGQEVVRGTWTNIVRGV